MDIDKIEEASKRRLEELIEKYSIKEPLEEIINHYTSVYIHKDFKQKRIRLLGIKEEYIVDNEDKKHKTNKKKTVQLYVLSKRMIQTLPESSVFEISRELSEFAYCFTILNQILKVKYLNREKLNIINLNAMSEEDYLLLKQ
jgi:hypothetical protein